MLFPAILFKIAKCCASLAVLVFLVLALFAHGSWGNFWLAIVASLALGIIASLLKDVVALTKRFWLSFKSQKA